MSNVIYDLRCEHLAAPLGIGTPYPRFSWKMKTVPLVCRIQCGEWDSGEFAPGNMPVVYAGTPLLPQKKYSWRVAVRTEKGWEREERERLMNSFPSSRLCFSSFQQCLRWSSSASLPGQQGFSVRLKGLILM